MHIEYNIEKLEKIISGLSTLTGIAINFCDTDGNTLIRCTQKKDFCSYLQTSSSNLMQCRLSDAEILSKCKQSQKLEYHICYAGLCDMALPIYKKDTLAGYVILGRFRTENTSCRIHSEQMNIRYLDTPFLTPEKIACLEELLPQILFSNTIEINFDDFLERITDYIHNHLAENLTVQSLCSLFHISKNSLYDAFHSTFSCTIHEYISGTRMEYAKQLLLETNEPVYRIAEHVGIDNFTYFCRLFKKKEGLTPGEFRRKSSHKTQSGT